jgi:hypothetical protein
MCFLQLVSKHDQLASDEERAKNNLVVLSQPIRQVNIEVVDAVSGVPSGQIRQRAFAAIDSQHAAFQQNESGKDGSPAESA